MTNSLNDNNVIVTINNPIIPVKFTSSSKDGKWVTVQNAWFKAFTKGETMTLAVFKHRYKGLLSAVGFKNNTCKVLARMITAESFN